MRTALASLLVVTWVLFIGSIADFQTREARTAFALGVVAAIPGLLAGGWAGERRG